MFYQKEKFNCLPVTKKRNPHHLFHAISAEELREDLMEMYHSYLMGLSWPAAGDVRADVEEYVSFDSLSGGNWPWLMAIAMASLCELPESLHDRDERQSITFSLIEQLDHWCLFFGHWHTSGETLKVARPAIANSYSHGQTKPDRGTFGRMSRNMYHLIHCLAEIGHGWWR